MRDPKPTVLPFTHPLAVPAHKRQQPLEHYARSDEGNAEAFIQEHGANIRWDYSAERWLVWNGVYWKPDTGAEVGTLSMATTRQRAEAFTNLKGVLTTTEYDKLMRFGLSCENVAKQRALLEAAQKHVATTANDWDQNQWLIATTNGTIDLATQTFRKSIREDYITKRLGCDYNQNAQCPIWEQFIGQVFQDDQDAIAYIQRLCGYMLTGDTSEQQFWMFTGPGGSGKGTLIETITRMLGTYVSSVPFDTFEKDRKSAIPSDIMKLKGLRAVFTQEVDEHKKMATGRIKNVTGEDLISARPLYGEWVDFYPEFKIVMAVNHQPDILDDTNAMWRRLRAVPFTVIFQGRADTSLRKKLRGELPGILNWCLRGLRAWQELRAANERAGTDTTGIGSCRIVEEASRTYRNSQDLIGQWLEDEQFVTHEPSAWTSTAELYASFMAWQKAHGHDFFCKSQFVSRQLKAKGFQDQKVRNDLTRQQLNGYQGLQVRT
jgi:putative DNA primase/helicase